LKAFTLTALQARRNDRHYRLVQREIVNEEIKKVLEQKHDFEQRKSAVLENNEEWTEGEFKVPIPEEPAIEIDNDIDEEDLPIDRDFDQEKPVEVVKKKEEPAKGTKKK